MREYESLTIPCACGILGIARHSFHRGGRIHHRLLMAAEGALFMDNTDPTIGATQFSIYMGIGNGGMALGESLIDED